MHTTTSGSTASPAPASHALRPTKGRPAARSGAAQQIAARTAPTVPARIRARSFISTALLLHRMGRIARIHAGGRDGLRVRLGVVEEYGGGLGLERNRDLGDAGDRRHRVLHD